MREETRYLYKWNIISMMEIYESSYGKEALDELIESVNARRGVPYVDDLSIKPAYPAPPENFEDNFTWWYCRCGKVIGEEEICDCDETAFE